LPGVDGNPLKIDGLWGLTPDNGGNAGSTNTIYFSAGPRYESHGLLGAITPGEASPVPEPSSVILGRIAVGMFTARWGFKQSLPGSGKTVR
jgi:hypothetical protein